MGTEGKKPVPDADLVQASAGGDPEAFRELMERYKGRAYAVALGILGDPDEAIDAVQDAFIKAFYSLKDFRGGSSFYTWFYRMLVNGSIDRWRRSGRKGEVALDETRMSEDDSPPGAGIYPRTPEELAGNRQLADALDKAIAALPEYHRAVILLREVDGLSYDEIAEALGCSVGTVMSRLHYARGRLKETLKKFREG
jgi:RNA polymerase sigma-70 factor (ECF subfamily)